ncbi:hypothetical protein BDK51DRAFT_48369 [Blyttiomyces helicus]|uniref:Uncharacterized protein n=1 Tax=Blyttiomyces helicus TaxID=388810 RepID=A0A4P9W168_9FUNG|nr:hypothetical protein BDK51DRAFT_48369 [Blyttiomyces helicus]|eukprot:RKO85085.1 hypothetical protein BDK51DRAFT_48369 [Blyttiomyces helicus]
MVSLAARRQRSCFRVLSNSSPVVGASDSHLVSSRGDLPPSDLPDLPIPTPTFRPSQPTLSHYLLLSSPVRPVHCRFSVLRVCWAGLAGPPLLFPAIGGHPLWRLLAVKMGVSTSPHANPPFDQHHLPLPPTGPDGQLETAPTTPANRSLRDHQLNGIAPDSVAAKVINICQTAFQDMVSINMIFAHLLADETTALSRGKVALVKGFFRHGTVYT